MKETPTRPTEKEGPPVLGTWNRVYAVLILCNVIYLFFFMLFMLKFA